MPAGVSDSDDDTREYPAFTGPYPRSPAAGQPSHVSAPAPRVRPEARPPAAGYRPAAVQETSALAALAGTFLLLFGLILTLVGGTAAARPDLVDEAVRIAREADVELDRRALRTLLSTGAWVVLVIGALHLLSALGIFLHRQLGRFLGLALALAGSLIGVYSVTQALALAQRGEPVGPMLAALAVVATGYILVLFGLIAGGSHFRRADADSDDRWDGRPAR